ncbi:hypothetical protein ABB37_02238 [Leptomonas pyrrhocoris]|uniref:Uncharacterized protein n=1 Tax=Leptomonas pyrrhocoris TaxID=157538 RepID=A0A0M9G7D8_LEPPY|nr:hypothetical protein ABB37_02238 [Leptomonas pyrrhocoris]XP_015662608.1 hypothetical protein ABB37_02238 [Leptomonas pyrrhocoris]XP_015662609.1 hypothetical protein ABB37_02238 [Leptomonas pyrrhocoris]XP_015662610.1 hypothetical protein ABB37_02238 [Leptomonas pyrrhocoris]KPA84168.1 hypothetical protein ABB37_02238 [Leptomonas pyrrhocoris]KPA84169.1 hypothetical protein ABB37_02238 [Leptomonas pyrrhocoris]KPA84170.1 hypothetical protein ABB37_02238 [Leptomonas pyrrhocoris]KPA84171.1 hypot|eukprot:XP_015662607.1 hypothetical protein ABB37_02238 [Leptomonas pyrrhocoris]
MLPRDVTMPPTNAGQLRSWSAADGNNAPERCTRLPCGAKQTYPFVLSSVWRLLARAAQSLSPATPQRRRTPPPLVAFVVCHARTPTLHEGAKMVGRVTRSSSGPCCRGCRPPHDVGRATEQHAPLGIAAVCAPM